MPGRLTHLHWLALALQGQPVAISYGDLEVLQGDARKFGLDVNVVVIVRHVERRIRDELAGGVRRTARIDVLQEAVHLVMSPIKLVPNLPPRMPPQDRHM